MLFDNPLFADMVYRYNGRVPCYCSKRRKHYKTRAKESGSEIHAVYTIPEQEARI